MEIAVPPCTVRYIHLHCTKSAWKERPRFPQHTKKYAHLLSRGIRHVTHQAQVESRTLRPLHVPRVALEPLKPAPGPGPLKPPKPPSKPGRRCACSQVSQKLLRAARHPPITRPRTTPTTPTRSSHVRLSRSTSSLANPQRHLPAGRPHLTPRSRARRPRSIYKARKRMDVYQSLPAPWA